MRLFGEDAYVVERRTDPGGDKVVVRSAGTPALLVLGSALILALAALLLAFAHL